MALNIISVVCGLLVATYGIYKSDRMLIVLGVGLIGLPCVNPRHNIRYATIATIPRPDGRKVQVEMKVRPAGRHWEWSTWLTFDGHETPASYEMPDWSRPTPYKVRGTCRHEGDAWIKARAAANDARSRYAAFQVEKQRTHRDSFPL